MLNANRYGYYRQNYDIKGWRKLIEQLSEDHEVCGEQKLTKVMELFKLSQSTLKELPTALMYLALESTQDGVCSAAQ